MGILDENLIIRPNVTWDLSGKISDTQSGKKRKLTRKEIKQSAIDLANTRSGDLATAQDYLDGYVTLTGNESRKKLFNKAFQRENSRIKQELEEKAIQEELLNQVKINPSDLTPEEQRAFANAFRDRSLVGHIGAGLDQNLGDKDLLNIASKSIGTALSVANPITAAMAEEMAANTIKLGSKAVPYIDKMVTPVRDWFLKGGLKWYDPRHVVKTLFNPKSAYTVGGEAIATTLDLGGAYASYNDLKNNVWTPLQQQYQNQGYIDANTLPGYVRRAGTDLLGMMPIMSYADDFAKIPGYVYSGLGRMADDTIQSFRALRDGVEPVYGIRAGVTYPDTYSVTSPELEPMDFRSFESSDYSSRFLPDPPAEVQIEIPSSPGPRTTTVQRPAQYRDLSQNTVSQLNRIGLGRYDIQNLLDRGFSTEQMLQLADTHTPGLTSNRRAQVLEQRLRDMEIDPILPTRLDYLQSYVDNGGQLLSYRNRPVTIDEWNEIPETANLDAFGNEWQGGTQWIRDVYYGRPRSLVEPNTPAVIDPVRDALSRSDFQNLNQKLSENIGVFGDEWPTVQPQIHKIINDGVASGKSVSEIEQELRALYASYNKPFDFRERTFGQYGALAESHVPYQFDQLLDLNLPHRGNPSIRADAYENTADIPHMMTPADKIGSVDYFAVIDPRARALGNMYSSLDEGMYHGGSTFEIDKSAQSSPMAHNRYAKLAKRGQGITTFLPSGWEHGHHLNAPSDFLTSDGYHYVTTNTLAGTRVSPRSQHIGQSLFGVNNQTAAQLVDSNIQGMENVLNATQQKVFDDMGGLPRYGVEVGGKRFELPVVRQIQPDGTSRIVIQRPDAFNQAVLDYDTNVENVLQYQKIVDKYISDINDLLSKKFPDQNYTAFVNSDGNDILVASPNSKRQSLSSILSNDSDLNAMQTEIKNSLLNRVNDPSITSFGDVIFHQPVAAFKYRKHGGKITNNLNNVSKLLLNIQ